MNLRKEPTLLVVVLLIGAYGVVNAKKTGRYTTPSPSSTKAYNPDAEQPVVLAHPLDTIVTGSRDLFREPTESDPLSPADLPFPALADFPIVLPPLAPGQEAGAYYQLRTAGGKQIDHQFQPAANASVEIGTNGGGPVPTLGRTHDIVYLTNNQQHRARILDKDRFELALNGIDPNTIIRYEWLRENGTVIAISETEPNQLLRIELADTTENWVEVSKLKLPVGSSTVARRKKFVRELLVRARDESWVYKEAEAQAVLLVESTGGDVSSYRWQLRVLRAQGDLELQWQFLDKVPDGDQYLTFKHRARGQLLGVLGLWEHAEAELRRGVELKPRDPRANAALAKFLLDRARVDEAVPYAKLAHSLVSRIAEVDDRFDVASVFVAVNLARGEMNTARSALGALTGSDAGRKAYWTGAVEYADAKFEAAKTLFTDAAAEGSEGARLGLGICEMMVGDLDAAHDLFNAVVEGSPLLRHRALAALAILYERTGHPDKALAMIEKATLVDPKDPYVLYLLGRQRRIAKQYDESFAALRAALAARDDLIEANAEAALGLYQRSQADREQADLLVGAARFGDRLVRMDTASGNLLAYIEFQGYTHFLLEDMSDARQAFEAGAKRGSSFCEIGLALIDYKQGRINEGREQLVAISDDPQYGETRKFAKGLVDRIDARLSLEQIRDGFDRDDLGELWDTEVSGSASIRIDGEAEDRSLHAAGSPLRNGSVYARRGLANGGAFVSVEVAVQAGAKHNAGFAGLRITFGRKLDFKLRVGLKSRDGQQAPYLYIEDKDKDQPDPIDIRDLVDIDPTGVQNLGVFVKKTGSTGQNLSLKVTWNGVVVHEREALKALRVSSSNRPLNIDLIASASGSAEFDVDFESFRLVRRKEN